MLNVIILTRLMLHSENLQESTLTRKLENYLCVTMKQAVLSLSNFSLTDHFKIS